MNWGEIWVLYKRELRDALRERSIVVYSLLIPIFLYPAIMWAMMTGTNFVMGQAEQQISRVVLVGILESHPLTTAIEELDKVKLVAAPDDAAEREAAVGVGKVDAVLEYGEATGAAAAYSDNFQLRLIYDEANERSMMARNRLVDMIDEYREHQLDGIVAELDLAPVDWQQYWVARENVASSRDMGRFIVGLIVPLFLIVMISLGSMFPAVDATAGERERSTWETLISTAVTRGSIVTAKYLYVATMGCAAGLLNLTAMMFSMKAIFGPLMAAEIEQLTFSIPFSAVPVMAIGAALLALFLAAGMMIFAAFARSFKEGQSLVSPFYLASFLPVLFINAPGIELNLKLALIPVANVALVFREAIAGQYQWPLIAVAAAVELILIAALLWLAAKIMQFEDVLIGSYSGSLPKFIKERLLRKGR